MRIAYVSLSTPLLRKSWSGIPWYSLRELQRRFPDTHVIDTPGADKLVERLAVAERFGAIVRRHWIVSRYYRSVINAELERLQPDVVFGVAAAHKLALIDPKWPFVYAADALHGTIINYYDKYLRMSDRSKTQGEELQRRLLERTDRILLGSRWAADEAVNRYGLPAGRVEVAPMGANLDDDPGFSAPSVSRPLTLLFIGYAWERKGGPLILDIWRALRRRQPDVELHVVGAHPKAAEGLPGITLHGQLNKTDPVDYQRFVELYRQSHFFIMPSRQEAYGIVYCEAAAFGRPVIAKTTGGVETIVADDRTGLLFPTQATPEDYAERILALWNDPQRYQTMCREARLAYEERLNWQSWGAIAQRAIEDVCVDQRAAAL
ncbi:glycosyltransferase family 4 protein [Sphingobium sp. CAP-1]|uniref:glycosyltransferase family 4 protein n=1 Tax=Sphingobium sp. CAP-1 TaxID=2676077 RepID=UPI0012BB3D0B|nr:glycosyltransferase family 4 protein [Sphingobium sp. CAP-1]QGP78213.1 glycosyltransferase [Sphingobium sp. CAP-1]